MINSRLEVKVIMYAIDLFCGAGGFSEGILQAGFHIVYSSDKSPYVKETYTNRHKQLGLEEGINTHFELADIRELNAKSILEDINKLEIFKTKKIKLGRGDIDAIFGGPPCQGFSIAGKRDKSDPRNMLFREYLRVIKEVNPKYVVMENVEGFLSMELNPEFKSFKNDYCYQNNVLVHEVVVQELTYMGYKVLPPQRLDASNYGVPQKRNRVIVLAYRNDVAPLEYPAPTTFYAKQTVKDALSGVTLECESEFAKQSKIGRTPHFVTKKPIPNVEMKNMEESSHQTFIQERFSLFKQGESVVMLKNRVLKSRGTKDAVNLSLYPALLRESLFNINEEANVKILTDYFNRKYEDIKLTYIKSVYRRIKKYWSLERETLRAELCKPYTNGPKWDDKDIEWFFCEALGMMNSHVTETKLIKWFLDDEYKLAGFDTDQILNYVLTNKNTRKRLKLDETGPTMVTLPDDYIHPALNKVLTVREMARIQSFDDSFIFLGKRTTGGSGRKHEVPQFSQVGNAVPPLLAYAIANEVKKSLNLINQEIKV